MVIKKILYPAITQSLRSKRLWIIGLLTTTPFTVLNEWSHVVRVLKAINDPQDYFWFFSRLSSEAVAFRDLVVTTINNPIGILSLLVIIILAITLIFFFAWILMNAQAVLVYTQAPKNREKKFSLSTALAKVERLWIPLIELNLTLVIARLIVISVLLISLSFLSTFALVVQWILFAVLVVSITLLSFTIRLTIFKIVLEKKELQKGLRESWALVKKNIPACYEFSLLLYLFLGIAYGLVFFLVSLVISPFELEFSILAVILLQAGIGPFLVALAVLLLLGFTAGWIALARYTAWLSWYTTVVHGEPIPSYSRQLFHVILSYVRRSTVH